MLQHGSFITTMRSYYIYNFYLVKPGEGSPKFRFKIYQYTTSQFQKILYMIECIFYHKTASAIYKPTYWKSSIIAT